MQEISLSQLRRLLEPTIDQMNERQEPVLITKYGKPVAMMTPVGYHMPGVFEASQFSGIPASGSEWVTSLSQDRRDELLNRMKTGKKR